MDKEKMRELFIVRFLYPFCILITLFFISMFISFCIEFSWDTSYKEYCGLFARFVSSFLPFLLGKFFVNVTIRKKSRSLSIILATLASIYFILSCLNFSWDADFAEYFNFFCRNMITIATYYFIIKFRDLNHPTQNDQAQAEQEKDDMN